MQQDTQTGWSGWAAFAGVMQIMIGVFHAIAGSAGIFKDAFFVISVIYALSAIDRWVLEWAGASRAGSPPSPEGERRLGATVPTPPAAGGSPVAVDLPPSRAGRPYSDVLAEVKIGSTPVHSGPSAVERAHDWIYAFGKDRRRL